MAYDKDKLLEQAIEAIAENKLYFIEDLVAYIPCDKTTFYRLFPIESNEYNDIKERLEQNKIRTKVEIRKKLQEGSKATELLALYKLIGNDEERKKLSMQYVEGEHKIKNEIKLENLPTEELEKRYQYAIEIEQKTKEESN